MAKQLLKSYDCDYNGQTVKFDKYAFPPNNTEDKWCFIIKCPKCRKEMSAIYPPLGTHTVVETDGKLTFNPSIVCAFGCGFHVWLKDGVITDC